MGLPGIWNPSCFVLIFPSLVLVISYLHLRAFPTEPAFRWLRSLPLHLSPPPQCICLACLPPSPTTLEPPWLAPVPSSVLEPAEHPGVPLEGVGRSVTPPIVQEEQREAKLTLRPPSLAAPYAPVQSWQHQPEKLIFESCGYEANVSYPCPPSLARLPAACPWGRVQGSSAVLCSPDTPAPGGRGPPSQARGRRLGEGTV